MALEYDTANVINFTVPSVVAVAAAVFFVVKLYKDTRLRPPPLWR